MNAPYHTVSSRIAQLSQIACWYTIRLLDNILRQMGWEWVNIKQVVLKLLLVIRSGIVSILSPTILSRAYAFMSPKPGWNGCHFADIIFKTYLRERILLHSGPQFTVFTYLGSYWQWESWFMWGFGVEQAIKLCELVITLIIEAYMRHRFSIGSVQWYLLISLFKKCLKHSRLLIDLWTSRCQIDINLRPIP